MKRALIILVILVVGALLFPVSNLVVGAPLVKLASGSADPGLGKVASTLEQKCTNCHTSKPVLPFYASFPVAKGMIEADMRQGLRFLDLVGALSPESGAAVNPAVLAKLEYTVQRDEMPPGRYRMLHWDGGLSQAEKDALLGWIREVRKSNYATADAPANLQGQVLQPLPLAVAVDATKAALGDRLYHDKRLSGDETVSCASCHDLAKGGTDQLATSTGIREQKGPINAPTVFNAGFQVLQFWDGRAKDLQEQAAGPVENPLEMGATWDEVIAKLGQDEALVTEFTAAYPDGLSKANVTHAIAEFEKTLVTPNSKFDKYLRGDQAALDDAEKKGHQVFADRGCTNCHVGSLLGGASFELMGLWKDYFKVRGNVNDADNGRFSVTKKDSDLHRFKVPTLRNVALTQPYFHDGSKATLEEAVRDMGTYQLEQPLRDDEVTALVAFLKAQTGELNGKPL
ncbi:MAG: cytochrome c peroxidase [Pseudomonadota bacterium]